MTKLPTSFNSSVASLDSSLGSDDPLDREWLNESLNRFAEEHAKKATSQCKVKPSQSNLVGSDAAPFTLVTWNIWFSRHEWQARLEAAIWQTLLHEPDIFCFQEVTAEVHNCMLRCQYLCDRYEPTEQKLAHGYDVSVWVKKRNEKGRRSVSWSCKTIQLNSIFGRRGICVDLCLTDHANDERGEVTSRIRVVATHLESGRGMTLVRERQLDLLLSSIRNAPWNAGESKEKDAHDANNNDIIDASFLVGDYNFSPAERENELIESTGIDLWKALRPNDNGFTEDTFKNKMRYKAHGKHKQARYDRIMLVNQSLSQSSFKVHPYGIDLLGAESFDDEGDLWVSDHFGLVASVGILDRPVGAEKIVIAESEPSAALDSNDGYGYETP